MSNTCAQHKEWQSGALLARLKTASNHSFERKSAFLPSPCFKNTFK